MGETQHWAIHQKSCISYETGFVQHIQPSAPERHTQVDSFSFLILDENVLLHGQVFAGQKCKNRWIFVLLKYLLSFSEDLFSTCLTIAWVII